MSNLFNSFIKDSFIMSLTKVFFLVFGIIHLLDSVDSKNYIVKYSKTKVNNLKSTLNWHTFLPNYFVSI